jgi:hypothetical protein
MFLNTANNSFSTFYMNSGLALANSISVFVCRKKEKIPYRSFSHRVADLLLPNILKMNKNTKSKYVGQPISDSF